MRSMPTAPPTLTRPLVQARSGTPAGDFNTALGVNAGYEIVGANNIVIGANVAGSPGESNTIRIGDNLPDNPGASACFIGGINAQTATSGTAVFIDSSGKLGTVTSSARFKDGIKPMDKASEALFCTETSYISATRKRLIRRAHRSSDLWPRMWKR